jgi:GTPase SAR1 family protein
MSIQQLRQGIEVWIDQTSSFLQEIGIPAIASSLHEVFEKSFSDPRIKVVICGEVKNGKSSLINALISQQNLLPVDVEPCSAYITVVEYAPELKFEICRSGKVSSISQDEFNSLTAAKGDPAIEYIRVRCPSPWLAEDIILVDTPGLEDLSKSRTDITLKYLPEADVIIIVFVAFAPVKATEKNFVRQHVTRQEIRKLICVMNKIDTVNTPADVERALAHCKKMLAEELPNAVWIPVSARGAIGVAGKHGGEANIPVLRDEIIRMALREKSSIISARFARPARQLLSEAEAKLRAEEAGLGGTSADAEKHVSEFRKKVVEVSRSNMKVFSQATSAIENDIDKWLQSTHERLVEFYESLSNEVKSLSEQSLETVRSFINSDALDRRIAIEMKDISVDYSDFMQKTIENVAKDILAAGLIVPANLEVDAKEMLPPVNSIFMKVPEWMWKFFEILLLEIITPGGGLYGSITAFLERAGLAVLSKGVPFIRSILPSEWVKEHLIQLILESTKQLPDKAVFAIKTNASETTGKIFDEIKDALSHQVEAVETGLEDARRRLAEQKMTVDIRKAQLAEARVQLIGFRSQLEEFVTAN